VCRQKQGLAEATIDYVQVGLRQVEQSAESEPSGHVWLEKSDLLLRRVTLALAGVFSPVVVILTAGLSILS